MSSSHADALAELRRRLAEETAAARALDADVEAEEREIATARDAVVRGYADHDTAAAKKATSARDKADAHASELAVKREAARLRVWRAEQAAQAYETEHASELIAELEPAGVEAVEALQHHAAELVAADRRWRNVSMEVSRLLALIPGATRARDALGEHKLSPVITAIRKAGDQIESPMPTWRGLRDHEQEQPTAGFCVASGRESARNPRTGFRRAAHHRFAPGGGRSSRIAASASPRSTSAEKKRDLLRGLRPSFRAAGGAWPSAALLRGLRTVVGGGRCN